MLIGGDHVTRQPLYAQVGSAVAIEWVDGRARSRSGRFGEETNLPSLQGNKPWIVQTVVVSLHCAISCHPPKGACVPELWVETLQIIGTPSKELDFNNFLVHWRLSGRREF